MVKKSVIFYPAASDPTAPWAAQAKAGPPLPGLWSNVYR